jgi:hypothetical protein
MTRYWFRPKRYGYGATPSTWHGWAFTFAVALAVAALVATVAAGESLHPPIRTSLVVLALALVGWSAVVTYRRTEGDWRWRWGDRG